MRAWRLVQKRHASSAFDGGGARNYGGRWNQRGTAMVYAAGSLALAALEMLVPLERAALLERYVCFSVDFDAALCRRLVPEELSADRRASPAPNSTRDLGSTWARGLGEVVLQVPSAVVPQEGNYLLNPRHPEFSQIKIGIAQEFSYYARLR